MQVALFGTFIDIPFNAHQPFSSGTLRGGIDLVIGFAGSGYPGTILPTFFGFDTRVQRKSHTSSPRARVPVRSQRT